MNQTYHRKSLNNSFLDNFQLTTHDQKPKKSNAIYNSKLTYKQAVISGINSAVQSNTIFKDYNNFPSLSKCYSSAKMTKSQHNMYYLSKSFMSLPKDDKHNKDKDKDITVSLKHHRDKSSSTMQSTDERKEIAKLMAELKEKKDIITSLNKSIDNYIKEKTQYIKEMANVKSQLSNYKMENSRLKEEYQCLQASYDKLKNSMKTIDLGELYKDKRSKCNQLKGEGVVGVDEAYDDNGDDNENNKDDEEQSLSGICFTDKVKMEKTMNNNPNNNENNILPTLDFGIIAGKREPLNIAVTNMKVTKPNGKKYTDTLPKNTNAKITNSNSNLSYLGQKVTFGKQQVHQSEGNLIMNNNKNTNSNYHYFYNYSKK